MTNINGLSLISVLLITKSRGFIVQDLLCSANFGPRNQPPIASVHGQMLLLLQGIRQVSAILGTAQRPALGGWQLPGSAQHVSRSNRTWDRPVIRNGSLSRGPTDC